MKLDKVFPFNPFMGDIFDFSKMAGFFFFGSGTGAVIAFGFGGC